MDIASLAKEKATIIHRDNPHYQSSLNQFMDYVRP